MIKISEKIFVAGHKGLVGSAILSKLQKLGYENLIYRSHNELDLVNQNAVEQFFLQERPDYVFLAAAKVGGINANNTYRGEFIYQNLMIQSNVIDAARRYGTKRLLFLGSSCIYPREALQPMKEEYLLTGSLEPTNEPYAIAKISGIKMCEAYNYQYNTDFISVMPTNLYGPNDNFDLDTSHVLPALLRKFHTAKISKHKEVIVWGTGKPKREFLHVYDMADACIFVLFNRDIKGIVNVGSGSEVTIEELAKIIASVVQFTGRIKFDSTKLDGSPRKLLDISKLKKLGWHATINLEDGIKHTYKWYLKKNLYMHECS